jgi:hypothetical protein
VVAVAAVVTVVAVMAEVALISSRRKEAEAKTA